MDRIVKFVLIDILKNRIVLVYTFFLASLSWTVFNTEDSSAKGVLSLLNVVLLTVPLVSVIFSTVYLYNSADFIELLLSQPVTRASIWRGLFFGLLSSQVLAFLVGAGVPILIYSPDAVGLVLLTTGVLVTSVFVAIAFLSSVSSRDKARGIGISIMLWLLFALLFDGMILFLMFQFSEYPIEKLMVGIAMLNPLDLARIVVLLHLDVSAMMGYTGAIFKAYFGVGWGLAVAVAVLGIWVLVPFWMSLARFKRKDL